MRELSIKVIIQKSLETYRMPLVLISAIENVLFLITFLMESSYKIEYAYKYSSDLGTKHIFRGICAVIRKLLIILLGISYLFHHCIHIYIYIYIKISTSTKRLLNLLILVLHTRMFPACCFQPRTYIAQSLVNGVLNET